MPYLNDNTLSKLECNSTTLWVNVRNFSINYGYNRYCHLNGRSTYITGKNEIVGKFTVDSVNNSISDIQNVLGNPFDKKPLLDYGGQDYELFITGIKWDYEDHPIAETEILGHFLHYYCDFLAVPASTEDQTEDDNHVLWDTSCKRWSDDIDDLLGDDSSKLVEKAAGLIDFYKFYHASTECPTPSSKEGASHADDIAAIIAGTKPATVFDESILGRNPLVVLLLREAYIRGFDIETVDNFNQTRSVVVGVPHNVRQIVQIMGQAVKHDAVSYYYYERLGDLIGLPEESIDNFIKNIKDFGFNAYK